MFVWGLVLMLSSLFFHVFVSLFYRLVVGILQFLLEYVGSYNFLWMLFLSVMVGCLVWVCPYLKLLEVVFLGAGSWDIVARERGALPFSKLWCLRVGEAFVLVVLVVDLGDLLGGIVWKDDVKGGLIVLGLLLVILLSDRGCGGKVWLLRRFGGFSDWRSLGSLVLRSQFRFAMGFLSLHSKFQI